MRSRRTRQAGGTPTATASAPATATAATQVPEAETIGQFPAPGGDEWGALLEKDSPLTDCVSFAVDSLSESGVLAEIEQTWISEKAKAPVLE